MLPKASNSSLSSRGKTSLEYVWKRYLKVLEKFLNLFLQNFGQHVQVLICIACLWCVVRMTFVDFCMNYLLVTLYLVSGSILPKGLSASSSVCLSVSFCLVFVTGLQADRTQLLNYLEDWISVNDAAAPVMLFLLWCFF